MGRDITRPGQPITQVPVKGSAVRLDPFEHLFQHIKQSDPMLYEALKRMSRYSTLIQEQISNPVGVAASEGDKATFGLLKPLVIDTALTNYYICRNPGKFIDVALKNKIAPDSSTNSLNTILDICLSTDDGTTFTSIFNSSAKLTIPTTSTATIVLAGVFGIANIAKGNLLRIDCTQVAVPNPGGDFEVVLRWA